MTYGGCEECGGWIPGCDDTGYMDQLCSQACIDAREARQRLVEEDEEQRREYQAQEEYQ